MAERSAFQAMTTVFERPGQICTIPLPDGHKMIIVMRDEQPTLAPPDEPGEYEVDLPWIADAAVYPVAIVVVDLKHVDAWLGVDVDSVNRMIARVERAVKDRREQRRGH